MKFAKVQWCEDAERGLGQAMKYADDATLLAEEVRCGRAELWRCDDGQSWLITRVEGVVGTVEEPSGELVICCYQGQRLRHMWKIFHEHAKTKGFKSIRFHTQQPWIIEVLRDYEPEPIEYVMRVFIHGREKPKFYRFYDDNFYNQYSRYRHNKCRA